MCGIRLQADYGRLEANRPHFDQKGYGGGVELVIVSTMAGIYSLDGEQMRKPVLIGSLCALGGAFALAVGGSGVSAQQPPPCDFLTGGGYIYPRGTSGNKAHFSIGGGCKHGSPTWGHLEYEDKGNGLKALWTSITGYNFEGPTGVDPHPGKPAGTRIVCGKARTNLYGDVDFRVRATDRDEPGRADEFDIRLTRGGVVVYTTETGTPTQLGGDKGGGGNVQLHKPNQSNRGNFGGHCPSISPNAPDVSVTKSTTTPTVSLGGEAVYQIVVTAGGTGASVGVKLSDMLQADHAWSLRGTNAGSCNIIGNVLRCDFGTMTVLTSKSIEVFTTDVCSNTGLHNTATVVAANDTKPGNNTSSAHIVTPPCAPPPAADVSVSKFTNTLITDEDVKYQLLVRNAGPDTAINVIVDDQLPRGDVSKPLFWKIDPPVEGCSIDAAGLTLRCEFGTLAVNAIIPIHVKALRTNCSALINFATVRADTHDPIPANNRSGNVTIASCNGTVDVSVTKNGTAGVRKGDLIKYDIVVHNAGPRTAANVVVTDDLPSSEEETVIVTVSPVSPPQSGRCEISAGQVVTCTFASLTAETDVSIHVEVTTTATDCFTVLNNQATVSAANEQALQQLNNDSAIVATTVFCFSE